MLKRILNVEWVMGMGGLENVNHFPFPISHSPSHQAGTFSVACQARTSARCQVVPVNRSRTHIVTGD
jgi:hypothetical protein